MNRGEMKTQTSIFAGDKDQTRFSDQYDDALDRIQEDFALKTKALWEDTSWTIVDGQAAYDLPEDFMFEQWVKLDGKAIDPATRPQMDAESGNGDWESQTGTPTRYIIDPEEAAKDITTWPKPQAQDAGKTLLMRYFPLPAEMSTDSSIPLNSSRLMYQFHLGLCAGAAWLLLLGDTPSPEVEARAARMLQLYNDTITLATDTFKNTASAPLQMRGSRAQRR